MATVPDSKLRSAKPQTKDYRIQVGGNTYLDILTTGLKVWRMRYLRPPEKKPAILTLGYYPQMGQAEARQAAHAAKQLVKQNIDPLRHREQQQAKAEAERQVQERENRYSFERVAREWHQHRKDTLKRWKPAHADKVLKSLEVNVFPKIGGVPVSDLSAPELLEVVQAVIDRGAIETAKKLNQRMNAILRYAVTRKLVRHNEADNLRDEIPEASAKHNPYLTAGGIPAFLRAVDADTSMGEVVRIGILLVMHTMVRTREARFARWSEFDLEQGLWTIPAERMKMKLTHVTFVSASLGDVASSAFVYREIREFVRYPWL